MPLWQAKDSPVTDRSTTRRRSGGRIVAAVVAAALACAGIAGVAAATGPQHHVTAYVPLAPQRVLDTRSGLGAPAGKISSLTLSLAAAVPSGARAVDLNVTAAEGTEQSYLAVWPAGLADSGSSSVNFTAGQIAANLVTVPLGDANSVQIFNAVGEVHVVADLIGYYIDVPAGTGPAGPTGPPGANFDANYGYMYNESAQVVPLEADVTFDTNGPLDGVSHAPGTSTIIVTTAGDYRVGFSVSVVEPNQFAIMVNGAPAAGAIFGSGAGTQQNNGEVILTLAAGDILTLRNHTSASAVTLQTLAGGTQVNVNASMMIQQVG